MKILLIGKTGQLGGDILRLGREHDLYAPGMDVLDITVPETVRAAIAAFKPGVIINTAAFHNVLQCETEPLEAFKVNCVAVRDLAIACNETGCRLITFSSDYVFGGEKRAPYREDDHPAPLQIYGITRLAGEYAALSTAPEHAVVIRTCGLYGISGADSKGGNFVDNRLKDADNTDTLEMSFDQTVCPTFSEDLARAVLELIPHPRLSPGIYHLVNEGECTWHEFTEAIYKIANCPVRVIPVDRKGLSGNMRRPLFSVLANTRAKELGISLPWWKNALERYITARAAKQASEHKNR
jgi:dTDP-4-dehydrorhamnose reductase